ncbi:MAG TPA: alpha/beta hydrolase [Thermomicrobiales bacterium]|nr:alpha/beta hydrolase [Thermomicrobiales bacterium]
MPRIDAGGIEIFYESVGEGPPLVLQAHHHLPWMVYQAPYFSQFYRVITFDRRGTGRSASPDGAWTIADFARDLRALLDALGVERAIVGGASLGGAIACQFGLDYPERALALVIGHTVPHLWPLGRAWIDEQVSAVERGEPAIVRQPRSFDWEPEGPPTSNPALAGTLLREYAQTLTAGGVGDASAASRMMRALRDWDLRPRYPELRRLGLPALVIVGGREPQKTIELAYEWHQQLAGGEFAILPTAYHAAAREEPVAWNAAVHGFLRRHGL